MPGPYGVTAQGWVTKPLSEILSEVQTAQIAAIDPGLDVSAESLLGNLNAIMCNQFASLWELGGLCAAGQDPNNATAAQLAAVAQLTGTTPRGPQAGTVVLSVHVAAMSTLPAGSVAFVPGQPQNTWATDADVVNGTGGTGPFTVNATAPVPGYQVAGAGTITAMTPTTNWLSVTNPADAIPGQNAETDAQIRVRRQSELAQGGDSAVPAIQTALLEVANVVQCVVYENLTDTVNALGMPPHSIMALVDGGAAADIAAALFSAHAGGIQTYGNTSLAVVDSNGQSRTMSWQTPTPYNVWVTWAVDIDPANYAGDTAVVTAITGYVSGLLAGQPLRIALCERAVLTVPGVIDCQVLAGSTSTVGALNVQIPLLQTANLYSLTKVTWTEGP